MSMRVRYLKGGLTAKAFAAFVALVLCIGLAPFASAIAYADDSLVGTTSPDLLRDAGDTITNGAAITENGTYTLADDATGTITIGEGLNVTIAGNKYDNATGMFAETPYYDLNIVVGNGSTLTLRDVYVELTTKNVPAAVDFLGEGTLNIEGSNLIDRPNDTETGDLFPAVIHVGPSASASFGGSGILWGYKYSLGSYIGANSNEANGAMTFESGTWMLKGSQTGPVIGSDDQNGVKGGTITFDGGEFYIKAVAFGAGVGASKSGNATPDVVVNNGLLQISTDWKGPAIGGASDAGTLTANGGSIMTLVTPNAYGAWGIDGSSNFGAVASEANIAAAHDAAICVFDASAYADAEAITVKDGGTVIYSGGLYSWVINEQKNPTEPFTPATLSNWLPNSDEYKYVSADDMNKPGNAHAGAKNLYLPLSKVDHVLTVNGDAYAATWNDEEGAFSLEKAPAWYGDGTASEYVISTADELAQFASIVNGTNKAAAQDSFTGKTVKLADDIDLSGIADWTPIGTDGAAFAGTFDGAGKAITGLTIVSGEGGYRGLFGNNAGIVKSFSLAGSLGTQDASIGGADCYAGAVAYNTGEVKNVITNVTIYAGSASTTYAVGCVVGRNDGGAVTQCGNEGAIKSNTSYDVRRVGGVVGHLMNGGSVSECYNTADIEAWNYRNGCEGTGGVLGSLDSIGTVSFCYNTGVVRNGLGDSNTGGKQGTGGIVGSINAGDVSNCYAIADAYGPASAGVVIGKLGNGAYDHLFSLYTARSYQQNGTQADGSNLVFCNGADENEDGSLKYRGAALANSYNSGFTITNSFVKQDAELKSTLFVIQLNELADGQAASVFNVDSGNINGGYPVLAWQGGSPIASADVADIYDLINAIPSDVTTEAGIAAVDEAVAAYNALTDEQKALVPAASIAALITAQQTAANALLDAANAQATAAEQERASAAAAASEAKAQVDQLKKDLETAKAAQGLAENPMTVKAKAVKAKAAKKTTIKKAKAFTVKGAKGKVTFAKVSGNAKITVASSGKVTVKKGLKKGKTYKVKVLVCAAGNKSFAPAVKTVTLKVKIK